MIVTDRTIPAAGARRVASVIRNLQIGGPMERKTNHRKREPSRLALELANAFAPCAQWSEVRVERGAEGRRTRVILGPADGATPSGANPSGPAAPFDWAAGTL